MARRNYSTPEPDPIATDEPAIIDLVIADIEGPFAELNYGILVPHLRDRKAFGIGKHGVPLQQSNGRDHRNDAFQETLDLLAYLKQGIERGDKDMKALYYHAIVLAVELAELVEGGEFNDTITKKTALNPNK